LRLSRRMTEQQIIDVSDRNVAPTADLPDIEGAVNGGAFLCGPPDQVIEQLKALEERYPGLSRLNVSQPVGTPQSVILEQLQWFAEEVMPAFKSKAEAAVPAD